MVRQAQRREGAPTAARRSSEAREAPRFKPVALPALAAAFAVKRGVVRPHQRPMSELPAILRDLPLTD